LAARIRELIAHPEQLQVRKTLPALAEKYCSYPVLAEEFKTVLTQTWREIRSKK
jgi:hypothetical protein